MQYYTLLSFRINRIFLSVTKGTYFVKILTIRKLKNIIFTTKNDSKGKINVIKGVVVMIRKAEPKDFEAINSLLYKVHKVHSDSRPDYFIAGQKKYNDEELKKLIQDGINGDEERKKAGFSETATNPIYVYQIEDGTVVAYIICIFETTGAREKNNHIRQKRNLYMDDICVDDRYRRQGIARALFKYVFDVAKDNKCDSITCNVWALNPSMTKIIEKIGFKPLKTTFEQIL